MLKKGSGMNPLKLIDFLAYKLARKFVDIRNAFSIKKSDVLTDDDFDIIFDMKKSTKSNTDYSNDFDKMTTETEKQAFRRKTQTHPEFFI